MGIQHFCTRGFYPDYLFKDALVNCLGRQCLPHEERIGFFTAQYNKDEFPLEKKKVRQVSIQPIMKDSGPLKSRFLSYDTNPLCGQHLLELNPFVLPPWNLRGQKEINTNKQLRLRAIPMKIISLSLNLGVSCLLPTLIKLQQAIFSDPSVLDKVFLNSWLLGSLSQ